MTEEAPGVVGAGIDTLWGKRIGGPSKGTIIRKQIMFLSNCF
jgi:hypothetical protein